VPAALVADHCIEAVALTGVVRVVDHPQSVVMLKHSKITCAIPQRAHCKSTCADQGEADVR
jgi:hypothetical protein